MNFTLFAKQPEYYVPYLLTGNLFTLLTVALYLTERSEFTAAPVYFLAALMFDYISRRSLGKYSRRIAGVRLEVPSSIGQQDFFSVQNAHWMGFAVASVALATAILYPSVAKQTTRFSKFVLPGYSDQDLGDVRRVLDAFQVFRSIIWLGVGALSASVTYKVTLTIATRPFISPKWTNRSLFSVEIQNLLFLVLASFFVLWGYNLSASNFGIAARSLPPATYLFYQCIVASTGFIFLYSNLIGIICQHWIELNSRIPQTIEAQVSGDGR